jgi:hypothetical protein
VRLSVPTRDDGFRIERNVRADVRSILRGTWRQAQIARGHA